MSDKCKELQIEVLKEVRDLNPDPELLKEARDIMDYFKFKQGKFDIKEVSIERGSEQAYWNMKNKQTADWVDNQIIDVTPNNTFIDFSFNGSSKLTSNLVKKASYNKQSKVTEITLDSGARFKFEDGARVSKPSSNGNYITLQNDLYAYGINTYSYGSSKNIKEESKFTRMAKDIHKNIDAMKSLLHSLNDIDPIKTSEEHLKHLTSLFDMINPKFLKDVSYLLNTDASKTSGIVEGKDLKINIKNSNRTTNNEQTAAEIYAHEVMHTLTGYATKSKDAEAIRLQREIYHVMDIVRKSIKVKDLIDISSINPNEEVKIAQAQLDYVFKNKDNKAIDEFIAYGLTNELWVNKLKAIEIKSDSSVGNETLLDKLLKLVRQLFNKVFGKDMKTLVGKDAHSALLELSFELAEYNNRSINKIRSTESAVSKMVRLLEDSNNLIVKAFDYVGDKVFGSKDELPMKPSKEASKIDWAKYYVKIGSKITTDPRLRGIFQTALSGLGFSPEGMVQNIIRDFKDPTQLERLIEKLGSQSDTIDRIRNTMIKSVQDSIMEGFSKPLTDREQSAITNIILELDIDSLNGKYSNSQLIKLLTEPDYLDKAIGKAKYNLKTLDSENYYWHLNQANGLGYYLATHQAGIAQNLNSINIAKGLLSDKYKPASKDLINSIDEVSTLIGIKYSNNLDKQIVANLIKSEPRGIKNILEYHKGFKKESSDKLFKSSKTHIIKGYIKEIFDDTIDIKVAPLNQDREMREKGYEFVGHVTKHSKDKNTTDMALYKSKLGLTQQYYRSATRLTNLARKGMSLTDIRYTTNDDLVKRYVKRDVAVMNQVRRTIIKDMQSGELDIKEYAKDIGIVPVMDPSGKVIDYRYMMNKSSKLDLLDQNKKVAKVLGGMIGAIYDKTETEIQNDKVLDLILDDMNENYIPGLRLGKNNHEYIVISADSDIAKIREIYKILPDKFKQHIKSTNNKYIAVRRDMLHNYFGFRHASILDLGYGNLTLNNITPENIKKVIRVAELVWKEIIKLVKVDILVKIPSVMIGNIISNIMWSISYGHSPIKVLDKTLKNVKNIREYINLHDELIELELAKASGNILKKDISKINIIKERLKSNPIYELDQAGMIQAIVEDVSTADYESSNKIVRKMDEYLDRTPGFVKNGLNWLYLTEKTSYFKFMNQIVQYSDLVARATQNDLLKEKGVSKEVRMNQIMDDFVNYNKPASSVEEYLNQIGLIMFTKYMKRIQRALKNFVNKKPLNAFLTVTGQELIYDIDDVTDQFMLIRSYKNLDQSMIDQLLGILSPASYQLITGNK